ncbi:MAG: hypothetical protein AB9873_19740 [Syntrophobacteraceae bacterium]
MKIDDISGKPRLDPLREASRQGRTGEAKDAFEMILKQEIGAAGKASDTSEVSPELHGISGMTSLLASNFSSSIPSLDCGDSGLLASTETLLSRIESDLDAAGDKPRKLESIIQSLSMEADSLKSDLGNLPEGHPLKAVAAELDILAYVESVKWNRGDYL